MSFNLKTWSLIPLMLVMTFGTSPCLPAQNDTATPPQSVLSDNALLSTPVQNLAATNASSQVVAVSGQPFSQALRVNIGLASKETNATQLCMPIDSPVNKGDVLMASVCVLGQAADGTGPAQAAFLFERTNNPWTNSVTQGVRSETNPEVWKRYQFAFTSAESYEPKEAMVSLRFAFGPQTVEIGGLSVANYGTSKTLDQLVDAAADGNPLGQTTVAVDRTRKRQVLIGFGGDFCQARYGQTETLDAVGAYTLNHLHVVQARIGIPLNYWEPQKGVFNDTAQPHAALLLMQEMTKRRIPVIATVWEGPGWLLPGSPEQSGRTLPPAEYKDCIESIAQFLVTARDKYGAEPAYFSFNEPDYGVNFLFSPTEMANFIRQAGPRFQALGLKTKFLVGDTTGGGPIVHYAEPLLQDKSIAAYLGPVSFHCWDSLSAPDSSYAAIARLGTAYHKTILCTEAGHDSALWQASNPWGTWNNALKTALAYTKTLGLSGASTMDYWTYENNYPLVTGDGKTPYPVFSVIKQMEDSLPPGAQVVSATTSRDDLSVLASVGPDKGQYSLLLVNPIGAGTVTLTDLPPHSTVSVVESDALRQNAVIESDKQVDGAGKLTVSLRGRSVVTVIAR